MRSPVPDYLAEFLADVAPDISGATAGYIPELASADPERLGAVFATVDGEVYLVDPESILPDPDPGDGGRVIVVDDLDSALTPTH